MGVKQVMRNEHTGIAISSASALKSVLYVLKLKNANLLRRVFKEAFLVCISDLIDVPDFVTLSCRVTLEPDEPLDICLLFALLKGADSHDNRIELARQTKKIVDSFGVSARVSIGFNDCDIDSVVQDDQGLCCVLKSKPSYCVMRNPLGGTIEIRGEVDG